MSGGEGFTSSSRRTHQRLRLSRLDAETSAGESAQNHSLRAGAITIDLICALGAHAALLWATCGLVKSRLRRLPLDRSRQPVVIDAADRRPIGVVQVYVDADRAALQGEVDVGHQAVYKWLESRYQIRAAIVSQDISAVLLTEEQAQILGEHAGLPALRIIRRYFDETQKLFQIAVTVHRSADFVYNTRLLLEG